MFFNKLVTVKAYINSYVPHIGNGVNKFDTLSDIRINKKNIESVIKNQNTDAPRSYVVNFVSGSSVVIPFSELGKL